MWASETIDISALSATFNANKLCSITLHYKSYLVYASYKKLSTGVLQSSIIIITRNTFCGTWYLPHSRVHKSIAELCSNFGDSAITKCQIAYFSLRMRETSIILLPVKNLTSPSCSPTPISYMMQEFWGFGHKYGPNCIFFIAHAQNGLISTSCQKSDVTIVFPDPDFL